MLTKLAEFIANKANIITLFSTKVIDNYGFWDQKAILFYLNIVGAMHTRNQALSTCLEVFSKMQCRCTTCPIAIENIVKKLLAFEDDPHQTAIWRMW